MSKVVILGFDGIHLSYLNSLLDELPNFKKIMESGISGKLQSCHPPSPEPVWASLITGLDPGQLGIYGNYQRNSFDDYEVSFVNSANLTEPTIWELLGTHGYQSIIMGVPLSAPAKAMVGCLLSCSCSDGNAIYTYPESLQKELSRELGECTSNCTDLDSLYELTQKRFSAARTLLTNKEWDFFMIVDSSLLHAQSLSWEQDSRAHYKRLDCELGSILNLVPDNTRIIILSGYGSRSVEGIFHLNEWLIQEGYLKLKAVPENPVPLTADLVDWKQTHAWGMGGTYGSVFLNIKRRDSQGIIPKEKVEYIQNRFIHKVISLTDQAGIPLYIKVLNPSEIFAKTAGVFPDLFLNFRNHSWRSSSFIGTGEIHSRTVSLYEKVNNNLDGVFISTTRSTEEQGKTIGDVGTIDLAPTILREFGVMPLKGMAGKAI